MLYTDGNPNFEEIKGTRLRTIDSSLSSLVFSPLHDFILRRTPTWVSPSVFTLASLVLSTSYFFMTLRNGAFNQATYAPWAFSANALVIFISWLSTTLDERQVRRTGRSSPLSEFLRNGVAGPLALTYTIILTVSALRLPADEEFMKLFWASSVTYFLSLWATYLTGRFEHFYFGTREVQFTAIVVNLVLAYHGNQPECDCGKWFYIISLGLLGLSSASSILRGTRASLELEIIEIVAGFFLALPAVWTVVASYWWLSYSAQNSVPSILLLTTLFVYVDARLVFARICQFASDIFYIILLPLSVVAFYPTFYEKFGFSDERTFIFSYLSASVLFALHFVWSVVDLYVNFCDGQLFQVEPVKRQRQPKKEPEPTQAEDKLFEEDPEDEDFNPESEGEDDEAGIEPEEDILDESELKPAAEEAQ